MFSTKSEQQANNTSIFARFRGAFQRPLTMDEEQQEREDSDLDSQSSTPSSPNSDFSDVDREELEQLGLLNVQTSRPVSLRRVSRIEERSSLRIKHGLEPNEELLRAANIEVTPEIRDRLGQIKQENPEQKTAKEANERQVVEEGGPRQTVAELRAEVMAEEFSNIDRQMSEMAIEAGKIFYLMCKHLASQSTLTPATVNEDWELSLEQDLKKPAKTRYKISPLVSSNPTTISKNRKVSAQVNREALRQIKNQHIEILGKNLLEFFGGEVKANEDGVFSPHFPQRVQDNELCAPYVKLTKDLLTREASKPSLGTIQKKIEEIDKENVKKFKVSTFFDSEEVIALIDTIRKCSLDNQEDEPNELLRYLEGEFIEKRDNLYLFENILAVTELLEDNKVILSSEIEALCAVPLLDAHLAAKNHVEKQAMFLLRKLREPTLGKERINGAHRLFRRAPDRSTVLTIAQAEEQRLAESGQEFRDYIATFNKHRSAQSLANNIHEAFNTIEPNKENSGSMEQFAKILTDLFFDSRPENEELNLDTVIEQTNWVEDEAHKDFLKGLLMDALNAETLGDAELTLKKLTFLTNKPGLVKSLEKFGISYLDESLEQLFDKLNLVEHSFAEIEELSKKTHQITAYDTSSRNNLFHLYNKFDLASSNEKTKKEGLNHTVRLREHLVSSLENNSDPVSLQQEHKILAETLGKKVEKLVQQKFSAKNTEKELKKTFIEMAFELAKRTTPPVSKAAQQMLKKDLNSRYDDCAISAREFGEELLPTLKSHLTISLNQIQPVYHTHSEEEARSMSFENYLTPTVSFSDEELLRAITFMEAISKELQNLSLNQKLIIDGTLSCWQVSADGLTAIFNGSLQKISSKDNISPEEIERMNFQHLSRLILELEEIMPSASRPLSVLKQMLSSETNLLDTSTKELTFQRFKHNSMQYPQLQNTGSSLVDLESLAKEIIEECAQEKLTQDEFDNVLKSRFIDQLYDNVVSQPQVCKMLDFLSNVGIDVESESFKSYVLEPLAETTSAETLKEILRNTTGYFHRLSAYGFNVESQPFRDFIKRFNLEDRKQQTSFKDGLAKFNDVVEIYLGDNDKNWPEKLSGLDDYALAANGSDIKELKSMIQIHFLNKLLTFSEQKDLPLTEQEQEQLFDQSRAAFPQPDSALLELGSLRKKLNKPRERRVKEFKEAAQSFDEVTSYLLNTPDPNQRNIRVFDNSSESQALVRFLKEHKKIFQNRYDRIKLLNPHYHKKTMAERMRLKKQAPNLTKSELKSRALDVELRNISLNDPDDLEFPSRSQDPTEDLSSASSEESKKNKLQELIGYFARSLALPSAAGKSKITPINQKDFLQVQANLSLVDIQINEHSFRDMQNSFTKEMDYEDFISHLKMASTALSDCKESVCEFFREDFVHKTERSSYLLAHVFDAAAAGADDITLAFIVTNHIEQQRATHSLTSGTGT